MTEWAKEQRKDLNNITNRYTQRQAAQAKRQQDANKAQFNNFVAKQGGGKRHH